MKIPKLMLITDGNLEINTTNLDKVVSACHHGIPAIQMREKIIEGRTLWNLGKILRKVTSDHGVFFSINDRLDIALAVDADAVHLSERGLSPEVPKKLKPSLIVGVSVHSLEMGKRAEQEGADYVLFGPIFQTPSKLAFGKPQGLENLEKMTSTLSIPVLAIGGITPLQIKNCIDAGAYGIAALGAFMQSEDIKQTVNEFLGELK